AFTNCVPDQRGSALQGIIPDTTLRSDASETARALHRALLVFNLKDFFGSHKNDMRISAELVVPKQSSAPTGLYSIISLFKKFSPRSSDDPRASKGLFARLVAYFYARTPASDVLNGTLLENIKRKQGQPITQEQAQKYAQEVDETLTKELSEYPVQNNSTVEYEIPIIKASAIHPPLHDYLASQTYTVIEDLPNKNAQIKNCLAHDNLSRKSELLKSFMNAVLKKGLTSYLVEVDSAKDNQNIHKSATQRYDIEKTLYDAAVTLNGNYFINDKDETLFVTAMEEYLGVTAKASKKYIIERLENKHGSNVRDLLLKDFSAALLVNTNAVPNSLYDASRNYAISGKTKADKETFSTHLLEYCNEEEALSAYSPFSTFSFYTQRPVVISPKPHRPQT
ncbi:MAG TPA: hypothetical protein VI522_05475, partial [Gammaproteobacteria bacterium]|nr:hypothetical protein [Gammaproteobacteria bacterium]